MVRQKIQKCTSCGRYTLKRVCPECGSVANVAAPMKWSPEDPQAHRRRELNNVESDEWDSTIPTLENNNS